MIEAGFDDLLATNAAIGALVSGIHAVKLPANAKFPTLTYQFVGSRSDPTFETSGSQRARVQIDCFGLTYQDAATLRRTLISELNGYVGTLSDNTVLQNMDLNQWLDYPYEPDAALFRCGAEFYLYFNLP